MTRIDHGSSAAREAHEAAAEAQQKSQAGTQAENRHVHTQHASTKHASQVVKAKIASQHVQQRARIAHKTQIASFYHSKRFATTHAGKMPSLAAQKLLNRLGTRPPVPSRKHAHGKEHPAGEHRAQHEGHEAAHHAEHEQAHLPHEHAHPHQQHHTPKKLPLARDQEQQKQKQQQQQQGKQGQQQEHAQQQAQTPPQDQKSGEQQARDQGQPKDAEKDAPHSTLTAARTNTSFALSSKAAITTPSAPTQLEALAATLHEAQALPQRLSQRLAAEYAQAIVQLAGKVEFGFAMAPLMIMNMMSPAAKHRNISRLHAQLAAGAVGKASGSEGASPSVAILAQTLDATQARQRFSIAYTHEAQSLVSVKQLLIDAAAPSARPSATLTKQPTHASQNTSEVRVSNLAPRTKP